MFSGSADDEVRARRLRVAEARTTGSVVQRKDARSLVKHAQAERETRAEEARRHEASVRIQRCVRRFLGRHRAAFVLRELFKHMWDKYLRRRKEVGLMIQYLVRTKATSSTSTSVNTPLSEPAEKSPVMTITGKPLPLSSGTTSNVALTSSSLNAGHGLRHPAEEARLLLNKLVITALLLQRLRQRRSDGTLTSTPSLARRTRPHPSTNIVNHTHNSSNPSSTSKGDDTTTTGLRSSNHPISSRPLTSYNDPYRLYADDAILMSVCGAIVQSIKPFPEEHLLSTDERIPFLAMNYFQNACLSSHMYPQPLLLSAASPPCLLSLAILTSPSTVITSLTRAPPSPSQGAAIVQGRPHPYHPDPHMRTGLYALPLSCTQPVIQWAVRTRRFVSATLSLCTQLAPFIPPTSPFILPTSTPPLASSHSSLRSTFSLLVSTIHTILHPAQWNVGHIQPIYDGHDPHITLQYKEHTYPHVLSHSPSTSLSPYPDSISSTSTTITTTSPIPPSSSPISPASPSSLASFSSPSIYGLALTHIVGPLALRCAVYDQFHSILQSLIFPYASPPYLRYCFPNYNPNLLLNKQAIHQPSSSSSSSPSSSPSGPSLASIITVVLNASRMGLSPQWKRGMKDYLSRQAKFQAATESQATTQSVSGSRMSGIGSGNNATLHRDMPYNEGGDTGCGSDVRMSMNALHADNTHAHTNRRSMSGNIDTTRGSSMHGIHQSVGDTSSTSYLSSPSSPFLPSSGDSTLSSLSHLITYCNNLHASVVSYMRVYEGLKHEHMVNVSATCHNDEEASTRGGDQAHESRVSGGVACNEHGNGTEVGKEEKADRMKNTSDVIDDADVYLGTEKLSSITSLSSGSLHTLSGDQAATPSRLNRSPPRNDSANSNGNTTTENDDIVGDDLDPLGVTLHKRNSLLRQQHHHHHQHEPRQQHQVGPHGNNTSSDPLGPMLRLTLGLDSATTSIPPTSTSPSGSPSPSSNTPPSHPSHFLTPASCLSPQTQWLKCIGAHSCTSACSWTSPPSSSPSSPSSNQYIYKPNPSLLDKRSESIVLPPFSTTHPQIASNSSASFSNLTSSFPSSITPTPSSLSSASYPHCIAQHVLLVYLPAPSPSPIAYASSSVLRRLQGDLLLLHATRILSVPAIARVYPLAWLSTVYDKSASSSSSTPSSSTNPTLTSPPFNSNLTDLRAYVEWDALLMVLLRELHGENASSTHILSTSLSRYACTHVPRLTPVYWNLPLSNPQSPTSSPPYLPSISQPILHERFYPYPTSVCNRPTRTQINTFIPPLQSTTAAQTSPSPSPSLSSSSSSSSSSPSRFPSLSNPLSHASSSSSASSSSTTTSSAYSASSAPSFHQVTPTLSPTDDEYFQMSAPWSPDANLRLLPSSSISMPPPPSPSPYTSDADRAASSSSAYDVVNPISRYPFAPPHSRPRPSLTLLPHLVYDSFSPREYLLANIADLFVKLNPARMCVVTLRLSVAVLSSLIAIADARFLSGRHAHTLQSMKGGNGSSTNQGQNYMSAEDVAMADDNGQWSDDDDDDDDDGAGEGDGKQGDNSGGRAGKLVKSSSGRRKGGAMLFSSGSKSSGQTESKTSSGIGDGGRGGGGVGIGQEQKGGSDSNYRKMDAITDQRGRPTSRGLDSDDDNSSPYLPPLGVEAKYALTQLDDLFTRQAIAPVFMRPLPHLWHKLRHNASMVNALFEDPQPTLNTNSFALLDCRPSDLREIHLASARFTRLWGRETSVSPDYNFYDDYFSTAFGFVLALLTRCLRPRFGATSMILFSTPLLPIIVGWMEAIIGAPLVSPTGFASIEVTKHSGKGSSSSGRSAAGTPGSGQSGGEIGNRTLDLTQTTSFTQVKGLSEQQVFLLWLWKFGIAYDGFIEREVYSSINSEAPIHEGSVTLTDVGGITSGDRKHHHNMGNHDNFLFSLPPSLRTTTLTSGSLAHIPHLSNALFVFSILYTRLLFVMIEDEFRTAFTPFGTLPLQRQFTRLLKAIVFRGTTMTSRLRFHVADGLLPNPLPSLPSSPNGPVDVQPLWRYVDATSTLRGIWPALPLMQTMLRELYIRDVRLPFMVTLGDRNLENMTELFQGSSEAKTNATGKDSNGSGGGGGRKDETKESLTRQVIVDSQGKAWWIRDGWWEIILKEWLNAVTASSQGTKKDDDDSSSSTHLTTPWSLTRSLSRLERTLVLDVLDRLPYLVPFEVRVQVLRHLIRVDKHTLSLHQHAGCSIIVRRGHILADSFTAVGRLGRQFKQRVRVQFVDELTGQEEAGIDIGGPFKEFLELLVAELFREEFGLFKQTAPVENLSLNALSVQRIGLDSRGVSDSLSTDITEANTASLPTSSAAGSYIPASREGLLHTLAEARVRRAMGRFYFPNPAARILPENLEMLQFVGMVVGKALYEGVLLHVPLAPFFLCKAIGQPCALSDLQLMDPQLFNSLMVIKNYKGDVRDLCLSFTVEEEILGEVHCIELKQGGADIEVTNANRIEYVYAFADYHLNRATRWQARAFVLGLTELIDPSWLRMFNVLELQLLLSGSADTVDPADWERYCVYDNTQPTDKRIRWFWSIVKNMNEEQRFSLLRFTTCCSRPPLGGFRHLQPPFKISLVEAKEEPLGPGAKKLGFFERVFSKTVHRTQLPSSATCFNLLRLPKYSSKEEMEEKILLAISASGFHLS